MGAATAARLTANGVEVRTDLDGRSAASVRRARDAGMIPASKCDVLDVDFFFSILPPADAVAIAEDIAPRLRQASRKPVYVDFNAISPATARRIASIIGPTGTTFVDGGVVGLPPTQGSAGPTYYVSGNDASRLGELSHFGLRIGLLDGPVGAASALKMTYASINKGVIGVATAAILAAQRAGVGAALRDELKFSQNSLYAGFEKSVPRMLPKAGRWVAEMLEIAAFLSGGSRGESDVYEGLSRLFARISEEYAQGGGEVDLLADFFGTQDEHAKERLP